MANTRFTQFFYTKHAMPVFLDCNVAIGATGAVGTIKGPGIAGVTRLSAGVYQIRLQDNYFKFYGADVNFQAPVSGSNVNDGSFSVGVLYQITAVGTTNWTSAGLPAGLTATVGQVFKAATVGGAGTGTAKILGSSGIIKAEILGVTSSMLGPYSGPAGTASVIGGYITIKCLAATATADTALIAADPADGSTMYVSMYLSNSSVVTQGE